MSIEAGNKLLQLSQAEHKILAERVLERQLLVLEMYYSGQLDAEAAIGVFERTGSPEQVLLDKEALEKWDLENTPTYRLATLQQKLASHNK